jgi:hypothetical protein
MVGFGLCSQTQEVWDNEINEDKEREKALLEIKNMTRHLPLAERETVAKLVEQKTELVQQHKSRLEQEVS